MEEGKMRWGDRAGGNVMGARGGGGGGGGRIRGGAGRKD